MKKTTQLLTLLVCFALGSTAVHAALSYWDSNDTTAEAGATPTGTWGTDTFWSTDSGGAVATTAWTSGDTAVFSAGTDAVNPFTVTVSGNQTAGGIMFEEGEVTLSGGTITMNVANFPMVVTTNATINSTLDGTSFTKTGTGTLTLNGANTYTNVTTVSAGVVAVGNTNALGSPVANTIISDGATLQISGGIRLGDSLALFGAGVGNAGALRSTSGNNTVGYFRLDPVAAKSARINSDAGSTLTIEYVDAGNRFTLTIGGDGDTITDGTPNWGFFWGGEGGGVTKEGSGTLTINGLVNIRGTVRVTAGTVKMGASNRFGNSGQVFPDLVVNGTFDVNGFTNRVDGLSGAGSVINGGTSTLIMGNNGGLAATHVAGPDFTGVISGGTTLQKEGPRTQTLSGVNTYSGATTVNAGTLLVNSPGSLAAASAVTVNTNGTLGGTGTIGGAVTVNAGGSIGAGASTGKLTVGGGLDLSAGGTNVWELAANSVSDPGTNFDQIVLTGGNLTLGGSSKLSIRFIVPATAPVSSDPFWQATRTWTVISKTGGGTSNFATVENGSYAAGNFTTSVDGSGSIVLTFTPSAAPPAATPPIITSLVGAGTTSVTVNYTNTLTGTNYVVQYRTNLNTTNWTSLLPVPALGTTSLSIDTPAGGPERYYRVYYVTQ